MAGYFVTLVVGLAVSITTRIAFWVDLRWSEKRMSDPHIRVLAPALFLMSIGWALVLVGLTGVLHEERQGATPPVPMAVIWVVIVGLLAFNLISRRRRDARRRLRRVRSQRAPRPGDE